MEQSVVIKQEPLNQDPAEGNPCILTPQNASGLLFSSPCKTVSEIQLSVSSSPIRGNITAQQTIPPINLNLQKIHTPLQAVAQPNQVLVSKPSLAVSQTGTMIQVQSNSNQNILTSAGALATSQAVTAQALPNSQTMTLLTRPTLTTGSPSKAVPIHVQRLVPITMATSGTKTQNVMNVLSSTNNTSPANMRPIAPRVIAPAPGAVQTLQLGSQQFRIIPSSTTQTQPQIAPKTVPGQVPIPQPQRVLVPAPSASGGTQQIRQAMTPTIANLPTGTAIQLPPGTVISGGIVYVPQPVQQQQMTSGTFPVNVPGMSNTSIQPATSPGAPMNGSSPPDTSPTRPRKPCNCTKSQCLKLYCDCFANGEFCSGCNCNNCFNNMEHEKDRSKAIKACLERNPQAFHPKIGKGRGDHDRRHNKGCHCKRSGCLKNYCECYEAKILCTNICKCTGCKNYEESPERKTLMHLADAAVVRVQQQNAARSKLESQIEDLPSRHFTTHTGERMPFSFVTGEVAEATSNCLLEQAALAEKSGYSLSNAEHMILQEFGRCMSKIIHASSRAKER